MSRPGNTARNSWHVPNNRRHGLKSLILVLNRLNLSSIVMEKNGVLGCETIGATLKVFSFENGFELSEELKRVFNAGDNLKVFVNVALELCFYCRNSDVELNEISVESICGVRQELMSLSLESFDD